MDRLPRFHVIQGDVLEVLRALPAQGVGDFDAVLSDPPYGLSAGEGASSGFMGLEWDAAVPSPEVWRAARGVCRPGANVLAFGGTRTWDLLSVNMRAGGLESRDTVIGWTYASGWPKPADVSKFVDKALGRTRKVAGKSTNRAHNKTSRNSTTFANTCDAAYDITEPASPEAQRFSGYHANLKPSWEPALLFRVPLEGTLAQNALAHGVAGLNVDGCRIHTADSADRRRHSGAGANHTYSAGAWRDSTRALPDGRWPANQIFLCECDHVRSVVGSLPEALATAEHVPGCPVGALDEQSGYTRDNGAATPRRKALGRMNDDGWQPKETLRVGHGDAGLASRFFFVAKVSRAERADCAHPCMKPLELTTYLARLLLPPPRPCGTPRRILVPYSGSGSEMVGAILAGWDEVVGIELDAQWIGRANDRCAWAAAFVRGEAEPLRPAKSKPRQDRGVAAAARAIVHAIEDGHGPDEAVAQGLGAAIRAVTSTL